VNDVIEVQQDAEIQYFRFVSIITSNSAIHDFGQLKIPP
jgi:hypothetical protein